ncbi:hypothetical protein B5K11_02610 [Rhizobium leguminosarum bv. trifolii]|uniref:hypothetical protein n=1 Tax=Rhizobium leguminosarum TaxID=384 RepID=UPI000E2FF3CB|nr:hypothetical protein [Rhizobium leguminosarum]RFB99340.1 hypothetical protein B5K11_02610 [Rhizobium leguminosarum bv. trifolii]
MTMHDSQRLTGWLVAGACLVSSPAFSEEETYYQGTSWTIQMVQKTAANDAAYCELKTTSFEPRSVSLQFAAGEEAGTYRTIIKLRKLGWQLPIGATAKVKVGNPVKIGGDNQIIEGPPMTFKVESVDTMASLIADYDPAWLPEMSNALLNGVFLRTKYGSTLWFKFIDGNEPDWNPASFDRFEQKVSFNAYQQCLSDLSQMAADPAPGGSAPTSSTSPLKSQAPLDANASSGPPIVNSLQADQAEPAAPSGTWRFTAREEDWGETCFVETENGNVKVGFMASPGEDIIGYVDGVFQGETRATWHVDDKPAYVSDGSQSDYFGWHEFDQLPVDLLDQISHGNELAVTGAKGERAIVSLTGATEAVSKFKACFTKPNAASAR